MERRRMILAVAFIVLVTLHPYYLWGELNLYELGLYLPGIDSILKGEVPFRDFFYLRGPFELYIPAGLMKIFGPHVAVLSTYFYVGTILTLILSFAIAKELYRTRLFLFLMLPVLVARTFPRVVFTYWGGLRYAWGLLAIYLLVRYCKMKRSVFLLGAGLTTAIAGLTSADIGVGIFIAVLVMLAVQKFSQGRNLGYSLKEFLIFLSGISILALPVIFYLYSQGAIKPYWESMKGVIWVVSRMSGTILQADPVPTTWQGYLVALVNPLSKNFRHMTPFYCYLILFFYLVYRYKQRPFSALEIAVVGISIYGLVLYLSSFRNIGASNFEMALQVEKIILFYLLEELCLFWREEKHRERIAHVLLTGVLISSLIYSFSRYEKRFFAIRWLTKTLGHKDTREIMPLAGQETTRLGMARIKGMVVPRWQGEDFKQLEEFFSLHTKPGEQIFMFPELGALNFIINRPYVGRFPMVTLSWFNDQWHRELMEDLKRLRPHFVVMNKKMPYYFDVVYFPVDSNKRKFDEMIRYITKNYRWAASTPSYHIYQRQPL